MLFLGRLVSIGLALVGVGCWLAGIYYMVRTYACRKAGVPPLVSSWRRPLFKFFDPTDLTQEGIDAQDKYGACLCGFILCWVLSLVVGLATGALHAVSSGGSGM
jgi:hypothetical protein